MLRVEVGARALRGRSSVRGGRKCSFKGTCWVGAVSKAGGGNVGTSAFFLWCSPAGVVVQSTAESW